MEYDVGEFIEIPIDLAFGGKIPTGSPVRCGDNIFIVKSNNGTTITITPKIDPNAINHQIPAAAKNQYKEFYQKKMRQRR